MTPETASVTSELPNFSFSWFKFITPRRVLVLSLQTPITKDLPKRVRHFLINHYKPCAEQSILKNMAIEKEMAAC